MSTTTNAAKIIEALKDEANKVLSAAVGSTPLQAFQITSQGNMPYVWQNPRNLKFNKKTYDWIKSSLAASDTPLQFAQGTNFTNLYLQQATNIDWSLSSSDQAKLNNAHANASQQQAALLNAWNAAFGSIPPSNTPINDITTEITTKWANPPTTLNAIQNSVNLGKLLNNTPAAGQPVLPVLSNWLNALGSSVALQNQVTMNNAYLKRAIAAIQSPDKQNGGLDLDDGSVKPSYEVNNQVSAIENALKNAGNKIELDMTVSRNTSNDYQVSISGHTGFSVPIFDLFSIGVGAQANYFSSDVVTSNNQVKVKLIYTGVNLVNFGPPSFSQSGASKNWFWMDPIKEAIVNGYPARDVSGFKFATKPTISHWDASGSFSYLMGAAIANYPTIEITVKSSNYQRIQKTFQQSASSTVSFLGIPLASATESTYSNKVAVDASSQTVTITLTPPKSLVAGNVADSVGWILGVQPSYPAS